MYPIGMRLYEPATYYIKTNNNKYVQEVDPMGEWQDRAYYLKGRYRIPTGPDGTGKTVKIPIGLIAYTEIKEQIYVEDAEGNKIPDPYKEWRANIKYYRQTKTLKGQIRYHEILNITKDESYVFNDKTFYRIAYIENIDGKEKTFYTWARRFDETLSKNYEYYVLDDSFEEYVDAYVAPSKEYIYEPYQFYMHVYNDSPDPSIRKDEYQLCQELEFNFHRIEDDSVEYENDIIKYYKVKTILPHILHEVGTEWEEITDNARPGYAGPRYKFHPIKYKDFYNNQDFSLEDYCPCIYINGQEISVKDFVTFGPVDLTKFGPITELRCGNGVIVEVIYQTKEYNYILEYETGLYSNMQEALTKWETAMNNLHLDPSDSKYVDLSDMSELLYS
jgi:hypothetical protein